MANDKEKSADSEDGKGTGPLAAHLPADTALLNEARRLLADNDSRVDNLATVCLQDPIILIELLKKANALFFAGGREPITSAKTAIVRLGSDVVREVFESLVDREQPADEDSKAYFQQFRSRCRRIGIVCRIFSEALAKPLSEDCQAIGSMFSIGDMLAVYHFGETYVELATDQTRTSVNYKLSTAHKFDVEAMGVSYLRRNGIPESLVFAMDRDSRPRSADRAIMKPLCMAAMELVDAFDNNKWERFAPGRKLAPKSAIRLLQMNDAQYLKIYERTSEYLFSARMLEEKKKRDQVEATEPTSQSKPVDNDLQSEIDSLLGVGAEETVVEEIDDSPPPADEQTETIIQEISENLGELQEQFALKPEKKKAPREKAPTSAPEKAEAPQLRTKGGNQFMNSVSEMFEEADTSEELLTSLLQKLVDGPFEKAALIVVSQDRKHAIVVAARGPIGNGQRIEITDPLSPLAQCFTKVQSFSSRVNEASPFGCKSFAVAPIDADHDTPVALYADCGENGAISFEARRIFRTVVTILNQKLPQIPGGIPVELR
ncbi:MAG: HDOD domain-containing protein [Bdellovibrionales bacterium]|nr:HDOD domain-containing protein [Bdellovibrionales bacterium]